MVYNSFFLQYITCFTSLYFIFFSLIFFHIKTVQTNVINFNDSFQYVHVHLNYKKLTYSWPFCNDIEAYETNHLVAMVANDNTRRKQSKRRFAVGVMEEL